MDKVSSFDKFSNLENYESSTIIALNEALELGCDAEVILNILGPNIGEIACDKEQTGVINRVYTILGCLESGSRIHLEGKPYGMSVLHHIGVVTYDVNGEPTGMLNKDSITLNDFIDLCNAMTDDDYIKFCDEEE